MSLSNSFRQALGRLRTLEYSPRTIVNYQRTADNFMAFIKARSLPDVPSSFSVDTVQDFCDYLAGHSAIGSTIRNKIHGLSCLAELMLSRSAERGGIKANPTVGWKKPQLVKPVTKYLNPVELLAFLSVEVPAYLALARALIVDTGMRRLEAVEACVGNLQLVEGAWHVAVRVKGRRQHNAEPESKPVSTDVAEALRASCTGRGADEPLLLNRRGVRFSESELTQAFIRIGLKAGITRLTTAPHCLRHTANVMARLGGVDALTRARMLGHRSMRTLERYDHLVPYEAAEGRAKQRAAMERYLSLGVEKPLPNSVETQ
jgi:integrase